MAQSELHFTRCTVTCYFNRSPNLGFDLSAFCSQPPQSYFEMSKTPSRNRARSEAKTPLTPSSLISGLNAVSITASSPTKRRGPTKSKSTTGPFDTSNPFVVPSHSRSRPGSPIKRAITGGGLTVSEDLQRQAGGGVIRRGGVESRLDVVTLDYVPPTKSEMKRSRSTPAVVSLTLVQFLSWN